MVLVPAEAGDVDSVPGNKLRLLQCSCFSSTFSLGLALRNGTSAARALCTAVLAVPCCHQMSTLTLTCRRPRRRNVPPGQQPLRRLPLLWG
jgi:hypothetical protein